MKRGKKIALAFVLFTTVILLMVLLMRLPRKTEASTSTIRNDISSDGNLSTTTLIYIAAGNATSTTVVPTINYDSIQLQMVAAASTSLPVIGFRYEFSENKNDWYSDDIETNTNATTTSLTTTYHEYDWHTASSTGGTSYQSGTGTATTTYMFKETTPKPIAATYTRVVVYVKTGQGAIQYRVILKGERPY